MEIEWELLREKSLVEDKWLPISDYNYLALWDRLKKKGLQVSVTLLADAALREEVTAHNYAVAQAHFSYEAVTPLLAGLLAA